MSLDRRHRPDNAGSHRPIDSSINRGASDGAPKRDVADRNDPLLPRRPVIVNINEVSGGDADQGAGSGQNPGGGDGAGGGKQTNEGGSSNDRTGQECPSCRLPNTMIAVFCSSCGTHMGRYRQANGSLNESRRLLSARKYQESIAVATRGLSSHYLQEELTSVRTAAQLACDRLQILRQRVLTLWKRGQYEEIESPLRESLDLDPSQSDLQQIRERLPERRRAKHVRTLKSTLDEYCASGQHEKATSLLDELRRLVPDDPEVLRFEDEIPRAVRRNKSSPYIKRAELALHAHESETAKRHAEMALKNDPFSDEARRLQKLAERMIAERSGKLRRAQALADEHKLDEAIALVRELSRRCETDREARIFLGGLIDRKRRVDGLRDAAESSLRRRRLADAARGWAELDRIEPGHPAAADGLLRCRQLKRRRAVRRSVATVVVLAGCGFGLWVAVGGGSRAAMVRDQVVSLADRARMIGAFGSGAIAVNDDAIGIQPETQQAAPPATTATETNGVVIASGQNNDRGDEVNAVRESIRRDLGAVLRSSSASIESARRSMADVLADGAEALALSGQFREAAHAAGQLAAYADLERPAEVIALVRRLIAERTAEFSPLLEDVSARAAELRASAHSSSGRLATVLRDADAAIERASSLATALLFDDARHALADAENRLDAAAGLLALESQKSAIAEHGLAVRLDVASFRTVRVRLAGSAGTRTAPSWTLRGAGDWSAPGSEAAVLVEQLPVTVEILRPPTAGGTVLATLQIGRLPGPDEVLVIRETGATQERAIEGVVDRPGTWSWEILPK